MFKLCEKFETGSADRNWMTECIKTTPQKYLIMGTKIQSAKRPNNILPNIQFIMEVNVKLS